MRIISGSAKGRRLKAPPGLNTRPITDMIKEALFNVWGSRIIGATVLDLFAGSGSVGIEALSRGAQYVMFVDNSADAIKAIRENLNHCRFEMGHDVYRGDVFHGLRRIARQSVKFDLIYIDPPFTQDNLFKAVMVSLSQINILESGGIIVIRTPRKKDMPSFGSLEKYRHDNYGESSLHYYRRYEEEPKDDGNISYTG